MTSSGEVAVAPVRKTNENIQSGKRKETTSYGNRRTVGPKSSSNETWRDYGRELAPWGGGKEKG